MSFQITRSIGRVRARRSVFVVAAAIAVLAVVASTTLVMRATVATAAGRGSTATASTRPDVVLTAGASYQKTFASTGGQGLIDLTAWAPGVDWQRTGDESAVASVYVDGTYQTDLLVPGADPVHRQLQLGDLSAGTHRLRIAFSASHSAPGAGRINLADVRPTTVGSDDASYVALAHAPILYGRSMASYGGPMQSSWTDAPLVAWHYATPAADGGTELEYQIVWSNEDGGTDTEPPSEQARWGRMTDIEWVYRVTVDAQGRTVPGSETFQSAAHGTSPFTGTHEGGHAVLQTCTDNNNMCDALDNAKMRFFLSAVPTMNPTTEAREQIMERFPWTYAVMGKEMIRERHTERKADPATAELSDARNYLYVVIDKTTSDPTANESSPWVGVAVGVQLKGSAKVYRSDHDIPAWSLQRDGQDATDVELPAGTTMKDLKKIEVIRFPTSVRADPGYSVSVSSMNRAYLLDKHYVPKTPITWQGTATLTESDPTATLWSR